MIFVTINSIEVFTQGINISNNITHTPDTCSFTLLDPDNVPLAGQEVFCTVDNAAGTVLFAGVIVSAQTQTLVPNQTPANRKYAYSVSCQDFSRLLNQRLVIETYVSRKSDFIIDDIVTNFTNSAFGFTTNNVQVSRTLTRIVFNYIPVFDAIMALADLLEWDWYVDSDKDIHFFERETRSAPFNITDSVVASTVSNFQLKPDYSQVRNRVWVRGGTETSGPTTQEWVADGEARIWTLAYEPSNLSFTIDVGGGPVAKTSAVDFLNADDGTFQFYWNSKEKYIRAGDFTPTATPANGDILAATYNFETPVIVRTDNTDSQAAIVAIEGGDGIYEAIIRDETIDDTDVARDRGIAEVNQFGNVQINGSFSTVESGFEVGQFVNIDVNGYSDFTGNYQIQRVRIRPAGPYNELYTIEFASTLYELKDFLLSLVADRSRIKLRSDEVVDVLKVISESITVTDSIVSTTLKGHPVKWDQFIWNEFTWG